MGWFRRTAQDDLRQGIEQVLVGEYSKAVTTLTRALEQNPNLAKAYLYRGIAYMELGQMDAAFRDLEQALRLAPDEPLGYYSRARAWRKLGELARAEADFTRALELDPTNSEAWLGLALVRTQQAKHDSALRAVERAIALGHPDGHWIRAVILENAGRLDEAVEAYALCVEKAPHRALVARGRRGLILARMGRRKEALEELRRVWKQRRKLDPASRARVERVLAELQAESTT